MSRRSELPFIFAGSIALAGCSVLPAVGPSSTSSTSSTSSSSSSSSEGSDHAAKPSGSSATTAQTKPDADEGSSGPLQDKHEGAVVFANVPIAKGESNEAILVPATTLDKPLYLRAYFPKTPVSVLAANDQRYCSDGSNVKYAFSATLEGVDATLHDASGVLKHKENVGKEPARSMRTLAIEDGSGVALSLVPQAVFDVTAGPENSANSSAYRFLALASLMKPGKNVLTVRFSVGCDGHPGANKREMNEVATGQITLDIKPGELTAFSRKIVPFGPVADPATTAKLKAPYAQSLGAGKTVLQFAAERPIVRSVLSRTTSTRAIVRLQTGQCRFYNDTYEDPNKSPAMTEGRFVASGSHSIPCPE